MKDQPNDRRQRVRNPEPPPKVRKPVKKSAAKKPARKKK
jgi:hypothetical protein